MIFDFLNTIALGIGWMFVGVACYMFLIGGLISAFMGLCAAYHLARRLTHKPVP